MVSLLLGRRPLVFSLALTTVAFGACNCDEELYAYPGDLVGVVCSVDSGQSLGGVPITVVDAAGQELETTTDATGIFRAEKIKAGEATITIHSTDGEREATIEVEAGGEVRWDDENCRTVVPDLPIGTVEGCVCDDTGGAWVGDANVFVITQTGSVFSTATDAAGCFSLADVPAGLQLVQVQKGDFYEEHVLEVVTGGVVDIPTPAACELPPPSGDVGTIVGRVCAPDGETWMQDATVFVVRSDQTRSQDVTDVDGNYTLENVPVGTQTVNVQKGSFTTSFEVQVVVGQTTVVPEDQCALTAPDVSVAVVTGLYDRVQDVLADIGVAGVNVDTYEGFALFGGAQYVSALLEDYATLSQYDIVFLNCGLSDADFNPSPLTFNEVAVANLRQFVNEGGSVYASDWAYSVIERTWPESVDFVGNDNQFDAAKLGKTTAAIQGSIIDPALASAMATSTIELHYPLGQWVPMETVANGVTVYIRGNAPLEDNTTRPNVPHTVGFNSGAGRVIYTSFHQEPGISPAQERVLQLLMFEL